MVVRKKKAKITKPGSLAVVTCHFNWAGYKTPVANLRRFLRQMQTLGMPVFGMEVQKHGNQFETRGEPGWTHVHVGDECMLFQKEACINAVVGSLPPEYTSVAWLDADVWFSNPHAFSVAQSMLTVVPVVQLFSEAVWTDVKGKETSRRPTCVKTGMDRHWKGHPGFAWAAQRRMWDEAGGLYSITPVGHGDSIFAVAVTDGDLQDVIGNPYGVGINTERHQKWQEIIREFVRGRAMWVEGECWHEWHGDLKNRRYAQRTEVLHAFDCEKHLLINSHGLLQWSALAPQGMRQYVKDYFENRKEDTSHE